MGKNALNNMSNAFAKRQLYRQTTDITINHSRYRCNAFQLMLYSGVGSMGDMRAQESMDKIPWGMTLMECYTSYIIEMHINSH